MGRIIFIHAGLLIAALTVFFTLGAIDKARLEKASASHNPELLFNHARHLIEDGGSIYWESLIYSAEERRAALVYEEKGIAKVSSFQGVWWEWKYHNAIWICLIVGGSFMGSLITSLKIKQAEHLLSPDRQETK